MLEINYMFISTDTQLYPLNVKIYYLRFEIEICHFAGLELSLKRKLKI